MKRFIFFVVAFVVTLNSFAQNAEQEIRKVFAEYFECLETKNFSKVVEYVSDECSKEEYVKKLESAFNDPEAELEAADFKILEIGKIEKIKNKYYSVVAFSFWSKVKLIDDEIEFTDEKIVEMMLPALKEHFGTNDIKYNKETDFFEIKSIQKVIVVSKNNLTDWKLIVVEDKAALEKILPKKILKKSEELLIKVPKN